MISFFATIAIKLALGLLSLVFVINVTGKGNLDPSSAVDQIQNFVLGGIIDYHPSIYRHPHHLDDFDSVTQMA